MTRARRITAALGGGALALAARATAFAQVGALTGAHSAGDVSSYGLADWLGIGLRLGLVLAVIWGAFVAMRWWLRRMNGERPGGVPRTLQIVETRTLGPNRALHLVRVGGRAVLIGVTPDRINQLMQIDDPEEVERLAQTPVLDENRSLRSFVNMLPGALMRASLPTARRARPEPRPTGGAPRAPLRARLGGAVNDMLLRLAGVPRRAAGTAAPGAAPARTAAPAPMRAAVPAAPRPAPAPARVPEAGMFDATPPAARALRARSGYRESQINEVQRAIQQARAGVDLDRAMGRRAQ